MWCLLYVISLECGVAGLCNVPGILLMAFSSRLFRTRSSFNPEPQYECLSLPSRRCAGPFRRCLSLYVLPSPQQIFSRPSTRSSSAQCLFDCVVYLHRTILPSRNSLLTTHTHTPKKKNIYIIRRSCAVKGHILLSQCGLHHTFCVAQRAPTHPTRTQILAWLVPVSWAAVNPGRRLLISTLGRI